MFVVVVVVVVVLGCGGCFWLRSGKIVDGSRSLSLSLSAQLGLGRTGDRRKSDV